jgi:hypothetical protein
LEKETPGEEARYIYDLLGQSHDVTRPGSEKNRLASILEHPADLGESLSHKDYLHSPIETTKLEVGLVAYPATLMA